MLATQPIRHLLQIDDHAVAVVEIGAQMGADVRSEFSVAATEQYVEEAIVAPVPVNRNHRLDPIEERGECIGVGGVEAGRRDVLAEWRGLNHPVERRAGSLGDLGCDDVGGALEISAVERHEAERSPKFADLGDFRSCQQGPQHHEQGTW